MHPTLSSPATATATAIALAPPATTIAEPTPLLRVCSILLPPAASLIPNVIPPYLCSERPWTPERAHCFLCADKTSLTVLKSRPANFSSTLSEHLLRGKVQIQKYQFLRANVPPLPPRHI